MSGFFCLVPSTTAPLPISPWTKSDFGLYGCANCPSGGIRTEMRRLPNATVALGRFGLPAGGRCHRVFLGTKV